MDDLKQFKEKKINDYISNNINFENTKEISSIQIKNELKTILNEEPGVSMNYRNDEMINEIDGGKKKIKVLESITIIFTYEKTISDGNGGIINIPIPVEKEFLIN